MCSSRSLVTALLVCGSAAAFAFAQHPPAQLSFAPQSPGAREPYDTFEDRPTAFEQRLRGLLDRPLGSDLGAGSVPAMLHRLGKHLRVPLVLRCEPQIPMARLANETLQLGETVIPLRAQLKAALRPHRLRCVVHDDALWVIPDTERLALEGIGAYRFSVPDPAFFRRFEQAMESTITLNAQQLPLDQLAYELTAATGFTWKVHRRSLEDIGLTADMPVTVAADDLTLRALWSSIRNDHYDELSLMPKDGYVSISTQEDAEDPSQALTCVYWLDGTGLSSPAAINLIEISVAPDTWEVVGGPSTILPLDGAPHRSQPPSRHGVVVSTSYDVHRKIIDLLQAIRESKVDPTLTFRGNGTTAARSQLHPNQRFYPSPGHPGGAF